MFRRGMQITNLCVWTYIKHHCVLETLFLDSQWVDCSRCEMEIKSSNLMYRITSISVHLGTIFRDKQQISNVNKMFWFEQQTPLFTVGSLSLVCFNNERSTSIHIQNRTHTNSPRRATYAATFLSQRCPVLFAFYSFIVFFYWLVCIELSKSFASVYICIAYKLYRSHVFNRIHLPLDNYISLHRDDWVKKIMVIGYSVSFIVA